MTESSFEFHNVSIGPSGMPTPILKDLSLSIARGYISVVLGATGAGKLYHFLKSDLGKSNISAGSPNVDDGSIADCGQDMWFEHGTLEDIIISPRPLDSFLYKTTVSACMFAEDIALLPEGNNDKVGSRGLRLKGGQHARTAVAILAHLPGNDGILRKRKTTVLLETYLETTIGGISRPRSFLRETPVEPKKGRHFAQELAAHRPDSDPAGDFAIRASIDVFAKIGIRGRTGRQAALPTRFSLRMAIDEIRGRIIIIISQEQLKLSSSIVPTSGPMASTTWPPLLTPPRSNSITTTTLWKRS
ncbi:hypothetical protein MY11210_000346 [Beauveria gryllotalpidicola]